MGRIGIAVLFVAITLVFTHPLSTRAATEAIDLGPDTRLFLWTIGWDLHALTTAPLSLFDANIFFPESRTLAYSEHQIGSALLAAPFFWTTGNLVFALNGVLVLSSILSGLFAFYLGRQLGLGRAAAITVGVVFLLSPPRFFRLGQLHLATVQWIPLALGLLHRYARGGSRRHLLGASLAFSLQALSGGQSALFLAFALSGLVVYLAIFGELRPESSFGKDAALGIALAAALNAPFLLPYLEVRSELGLERSIGEAIEWSPNGASFLASPTHVHAALARAGGLDRWLAREAKAFLFPGVVPILLALAAFLPRGTAPAPRPRSRSETDLSLWILDGAICAALLAALIIEAAGGVRFSAGGLRVSAGGGGRAALTALALAGIRLVWLGKKPLAFLPQLLRLREALRAFLSTRFSVAGGFYPFLLLVSLWASLGPAAGLYAALYRLVPGFDFIRVPSRFTLLTVVALAALAGIGFERLRTRWARGNALACTLLALACVELAAFPLETSPYAIRISPMDRFLSRSEEAPVAVFPIPDPRDRIAAASRHSQYMLHSTAHFFPLVNGYSGFTPPFHDRLFRSLGRFPDEEGISALEELGVRYVVFHRGGYDDDEWKAVLERIEAAGERLALVASYDEGLVGEIREVD